MTEWFFQYLQRDQLKPIRQRAFAATPGPWQWEGPSGDDWPQSDNSLITSRESPTKAVILYGWGYDASGITCNTPSDAEFIAHAREDIPALLRLIEGMAVVIGHLAEDPTPERLNRYRTEALELLAVLRAKDRLVAVEEPKADDAVARSVEASTD